MEVRYQHKCMDLDEVVIQLEHNLENTGFKEFLAQQIIQGQDMKPTLHGVMR